MAAVWAVALHWAAMLVLAYAAAVTLADSIGAAQHVTLVGPPVGAVCPQPPPDGRARRRCVTGYRRRTCLGGVAVDPGSNRREASRFGGLPIDSVAAPYRRGPDDSATALARPQAITAGTVAASHPPSIDHHAHPPSRSTSSRVDEGRNGHAVLYAAGHSSQCTETHPARTWTPSRMEEQAGPPTTGIRQTHHYEAYKQPPKRINAKPRGRL